MKKIRNRLGPCSPCTPANNINHKNTIDAKEHVCPRLTQDNRGKFCGAVPATDEVNKETDNGEKEKTDPQLTTLINGFLRHLNRAINQRIQEKGEPQSKTNIEDIASEGVRHCIIRLAFLGIPN